MASANIKINAQVIGLGNDDKVVKNFTDTATPVESVTGYTLISAVPTDDPILLDMGSISPASVRQVVCVAQSGTIYLSPVTSTLVTAACVLTAGNMAVFPYSTNSAQVWAIAAATTDSLRYMAFGVAT